jgi:hypothetical protein
MVPLVACGTSARVSVFSILYGVFVCFLYLVWCIII